ncbi:MAG: hypothetical protein IRY99_16725 [Isosphaeraceae bacterium]|nr:hypothetical protein [Isosphaeraceae bacterium]
MTHPRPSPRREPECVPILGIARARARTTGSRVVRYQGLLARGLILRIGRLVAGARDVRAGL